MKESGSHTKALIAIVLAVILGSGNSTLSKIALKEIPPFSFAFIRFFIATLCMLPLFLKERQSLTKQTKNVFLISLFACGNIILFTFGVRLTQASTAQMLHTSIPFLIAFFSYFILKERLKRMTIWGLILGFLGVGIIILVPEIGRTSIKGSLLGNGMILISALCYSIYAVLSKQYQKRYSPIFLMTCYAITTAIVSLLFSLFELHAFPLWWRDISSLAIFATLFTSICGSFLFYLLFQYAIKHGAPTTASVILYLAPVVAFIWASTLLGERLTISFVVGTVVIFIGAYLITKKHHATNNLQE